MSHPAWVFMALMLIGMIGLRMYLDRKQIAQLETRINALEDRVEANNARRIDVDVRHETAIHRVKQRVEVTRLRLGLEVDIPPDQPIENPWPDGPIVQREGATSYERLIEDSPLDS